MIKIPPNGQWAQNNKTDMLATLWSSFNLNLTEKLGVTKVSSRLILTNNGVSRMGTPVAFRVYNSKLYALAIPTTPDNILAWVSTSSIVNGGLKDVLSIEASPSGGATTVSNDYSDMEIFNNNLIVSGQDASLYRFDASTWTQIGSSVLTPNANHKLLNFFNLKRLYFAVSLTQIASCSVAFSAASSGANTFNISTALATSDLFIISLLQTSNLIWILTANSQNNDTHIITWDGLTADTYSNIYKIPSRGALAGIVKDNTVYIIDANGQLLYFNGGAFVPAPNGKLPVRQFKYLTNPVSQKNDRWIHPNGITLVDGRINILINNLNHDNTSTIEENLPSGIWEYDENVGWYHKTSLTQYDYSGAATVVDYGQNRISRVGALYNIKSDDRSSSSIVGTLVAGADYYTDATTVKTGVFINDSLDTLQKYGYAVTDKILSSEVKTTWGKFYERIRRLLSATDKIWVKYRTNDISSTEATITWVSTTSFTTTTDVSSYSQDDEVEVLQGKGGGFCSQISSISVNAGTYTVTVLEAFPSVSGTAKARFQHWKSAGSFSNQIDNVAEFNIDTASAYVQLKTCMLFTGNNEIIDLITETTPAQNIK